MRRRLDSLLAAPGLTRPRFVALAVVSLLATTVVIASALRADNAPYALLAAARSRPAPVVDVTRAPAAVAAARASAPDGGSGSGEDSTQAPSAPAPGGATAVDRPGPAVSAPAPAKARPAPATPAPAPAPKKQPTKVGHVFVVDIAGSDRDATWGDGSQATYLNGTLRPQGTLLGGYHALPGGDLATLIALTSGQKPTPQIEQGCPTYGDGCVFGVETLSLPDQIASAGLTWRAYVEDLGNGPDAAKSCRHPAPGASDNTAQGRPRDEYATRHNPFVYYRSLTDLGACATSDLPFDTLASDLQDAKTTANLTWLAPNLCDGGWETPCADGSAGGLPAADAFLTKWVPQILASPAYKADGLLIVLTDTGALVVSQYVPAGAADQSDVDAYSVLRYVEDLFGLDYLGGAAQAMPLTLALPR
jgi:hypothetical protein